MSLPPLDALAVAVAVVAVVTLVAPAPTPPPGPVCGDTLCEGSETPSTCPADYKEPPPPPPTAPERVTLEVVALVLDKLPGLLTALGVMITAAASIIAARRSGKTLEVSNGHLTAMGAKVDRLEGQLAAAMAAAKAAADDARQSAADVRAARLETPPSLSPSPTPLPGTE